MSARIYLR